MGGILSPNFTRTVKLDLARAIFAAARQGGAEPVGVFVEESAEQILAACEATGLRTVQLHGTASRSALHKLPPEIQVQLAGQARSWCQRAMRPSLTQRCAGAVRDAGLQ